MGVPQAEPVVQALQAALPAGRVRIGEEIGPRHHSDWTRLHPNRPRALLLPRSTEEVSCALAICHAHGQAVVPQGGLTGLAGGAHPEPSEIALSLEAMSGVTEVDAANATLTALAGTPLEVVSKRLRAPASCADWISARAARARSAAMSRRMPAAFVSCAMAWLVSTCWGWRWCSRMGRSSARSTRC
jgi:hypothetical protein